MTMAEEPELEEYEEIEDEQPVAEADPGTQQGYVQAVSFDDMQLKRELLRAVQDAGFEHPSEIQQQCIPVALQGQDVIGQAKSGMGKTAVFVLGVLHQLEPETGKVAALVLSHTRELAQQIEAEFKRFAKYMDPPVRIGMVVGGITIKLQIDMLSDEAKRPHIIIGTPGRTLDLVNKKKLILDHIKYFIVDECDKVLDAADMRQDVQRIFMACPRKKQVMMYSATMSDEMRTILHKFTTRPAERKIEERGLVLEGLVQHYRLVSEADKMKELMDLLDNLDFNQVIIFVKTTQRANALAGVLKEAKFPVEVLHGSLKMPQRQDIMRKFKEQPNDARIMVSTDLVSRGVDVERVNVVINFDMPETSSEKGSGVDTYLHRVGRAGRFGTRGIAITFVSSKEETDILNEVQTRFDVAIEALPDINSIDKSTYSNA